MCKISQNRFLKCVKFYIKSDYSIEIQQEKRNFVQGKQTDTFSIWKYTEIP